MTYYSGRVHSVVFQNTEATFYILRMVLDNDSSQIPAVASGSFGTAGLVRDIENPTTTIKGYIPGLPINVGTWFGFEARWVNDAKYGKQLAITKAPIIKGGWTADPAEKILVANGVPSRVAAQIRSHFGDDRFVQALGEAKTLEEVPGIPELTAVFVAQRWESIQAHFRTLDFLSDIGLPKGMVRKVWSTFLDDTVRVLSKDPWAMVQIEGITFEMADEVAKKLGLDLNAPGRLRGAVLFACKGMRSFGHVFMRTGPLFEQVLQMVGPASKEDVAAALATCHKEKLLVLDRETKPGTLAIYEPWMYLLESRSAEMLLLRKTSADPSKDSTYPKSLVGVGPKTEAVVQDKVPLETVVSTAVEEWGSQAKLELTDMQRQGVINALLHPISILTGLPGTGKTTSLKAAVRILQDSRVPFLLCAPTGIAAKNLSAVTGAPASTIHRAFAAKGSSDDKRDSTYHGIVGESSGNQGDTGEQGFWGYNQNYPYPAHVVIVDEASMVDQHLLYRLLSCTAPTCRLVFVGDHAQLPSVGPGNVLRDLIESGQFPVVKLTEIFRQKEQSDIVHAAHAIHGGRVPNTDPPSDFTLQHFSDENSALQAILDRAEALYKDREETDKVSFQILSPRHAGTVGVTNLNAHLRELLNPKSPGQREAQLGKDVIREDDRVMVVKNNYERRVFNGDVGKISRVDLVAREVEVKIFGAPPVITRFSFSELPQYIRLAYACTVHKAQGLEYDVIIMPIVDGFRHQLQRNLLYTAVTRAKQKVYLMGTRSALARAVDNAKEDHRDTLLVERLVSGTQPPPKE